MLRSSYLAAGLVCAALCFAAAPSTVHADNGNLNLHLDIGFGMPIAGAGRPSAMQFESAFGGTGAILLDISLSSFLAIEAEFGFGTFAKRLPGSGDANAPFMALAVGVRLRPINDDSGYNNEPNGNLHGNFWVSAHAGYFKYDGAQFGIDVATGYELSVYRPLSIGIFTRITILPGGDLPGTEALWVIGFNGSVELSGNPGPEDSDGDGLSDELERQHGTNPNRRDTDGDGIDDGTEITAGYDPLNRDTDSDGLNDGREDRNRDGVLDPGESSPTMSDTDGGGVSDGDEVMTGIMDPQDPSDDDADRDGVPNTFDYCSGTPEGAEVDVRGCSTGQLPSATPEVQHAEVEEIGEVMQLEGIHFRTGSAEILDDSEPTLQRGLRMLNAFPDVRVEIGGHTDDRGRRATNDRLSLARAEAVRDWLIEHGIDAGRLEVRGYGSREPVAPNDTPEGRQRNRRIEFRRLN